jgi:hypothetical protein
MNIVKIIVGVIADTFYFIFIKEFVGTIVSKNLSGWIIFAKISSPVIVLGEGLLKYAPASTAKISLF